MKTNYRMIRQLTNFTPKQRGILTGEEVQKIRDTFCIAERTNVDLQNLRDFVVLYFTYEYSEMSRCNDTEMRDVAMAKLDLMSGICSVVDSEKWNRGMEV